MHLLYLHMLLPTPQFVFVNSELVYFSDGRRQDRELS